MISSSVCLFHFVYSISAIVSFENWPCPHVNADVINLRHLFSGGSRMLCLGANEAGIFVWGAKGGLSAIGAKLRLPEARIHSRLGGVGERRKLPSGVWVEAPETDAILNLSNQNGVHFEILLISHF